MTTNTSNYGLVQIDNDYLAGLGVVMDDDDEDDTSCTVLFERGYMMLNVLGEGNCGIYAILVGLINAGRKRIKKPMKVETAVTYQRDTLKALPTAEEIWEHNKNHPSMVHLFFVEEIIADGLVSIYQPSDRKVYFD